MKVNFRGTDYRVQIQKYGNGRPAIVLVGPKGDTAAVATINTPDVRLLPNQVLIKDYSENAGMLAALENAGLVKAMGIYIRSGHVSVPVCDLLVPLPENDKERSRDSAHPRKGRDMDLER
jgi:hypothetical protein